MKSEIIRKLTSRKFIVALTTFITALLTAFNVSDNEIAQVVSIVSAFGSMIAYIFAEAYVDGKAAGGSDEI